MVPTGTINKTKSLAGSAVPVATGRLQLEPLSRGPLEMSTAIDMARRTEALRNERHESKSESLATRFTKAEVGTLAKAAAASGKTVRAWSRDVLIREARRSQEDMLFTELIATRMILLNLLKPLAMGQQVTTEDFARISATVRNDKRKVAQEIQQQYLPAVPKEA